MKKILMSLFVLGLFAFSFQAHASVLSDALLKIESLTKELAQLKLQLKASVGDTSPVINSFSPRVTVIATPSTIPDGGIATISWTSENTNECDTGGHGTDNSGSFQTTRLGSDTSYTITCTASRMAGTASGSAVVYVEKEKTATATIAPVEPSCPSNYPNPMAFCPNGKIEAATKDSKGCTTSYKCINPIPTVISNTPSITVLSPNSGKEAIESGQKVEIRWDSNVSINALVDVYVTDGTHKGKLVRTSNNGAAGLIYTLDSSLTPGSNYKACVSLVSETPASDCSDYPFTIKSTSVIGTTIPSITVLSPNGGESYKAGEKITLKWKSENIKGNIAEINLIPLDMKYGKGITLEKDIPNNGSYIVKLPTPSANDYYSWGNNFKIEIVSAYSIPTNTPNTKSNLVSDMSDKSFTIKSSEIKIVDPEINVLSPNGGESYKVGDKMTIKWNSKNTFENKVSLGLTNSSGATYKIAYDITDNGSYTWTIPSELKVECESGSCVIPFGQNEFKIVMSDDSPKRAYDSSDKTFTIKSSDTLTVGEITQSLDSTSHVEVKVPAGTKNLEVVSIALSNTGKSDVFLNAIQLGSLSKLNTFINNTKVFDISSNKQVGQTVNKFEDNGEYYYAWVNFPTSILIPVGEKKVFKVQSDLIFPALMDSSFDIGFWGLNFDKPGATKSPQKVIGNKIILGLPTRESLKAVTATTPSVTSTINTLENVTPPITSTTTTRTLKVGVKGDDVAALQTLLGITADGKFGPATKVKVIEWQKANNLKPDGSFGNASRLKAGL